MKNQLQEHDVKRRRLCLDARMYRHSGIGRYISHQIDLFRYNPDYELILLVPAGGIEKYTELRQIEFTAPIYSLSEQFLYPFVIPVCDVFWSPHYNVPLLPVSAKKRWVTIHDLYHLRFSDQLGFFKKWYAKIMLSAACKKSHRIITVSAFSRKELVSFFDVGHKTEVIHNEVDQRFFEKNETEEELKKTLNRYQIDFPYLLFVGNVKPHKNLMTLLKSFKRLMNDFPELKVVVAGKESGFKIEDRDTYLYLDQHPDLKQRVHFTGFIADDDLPSLYRGAKLFIFPSQYEGFGYPPLEALASGTKVLCSNAGPMPEVCGDRVTYFDPNDDLALSKLINNQLS